MHLYMRGALLQRGALHKNEAHVLSLQRLHSTVPQHKTEHLCSVLFTVAPMALHSRGKIRIANFAKGKIRRMLFNIDLFEINVE